MTNDINLQFDHLRCTVYLTTLNYKLSTPNS